MPARRFALVDLGSNSIRLVLLDRDRPFAAPLINEKSVVELGTGRAADGSLTTKRINTALNAFRHFKWLLHGLGVTEIHILATAAVREAPNASDLLLAVEALMGTRVQVLSGLEEARLCATGVMLACPGAEGLVADLGGGSLELALVRSGAVGPCISLPLGVLRLETLGLSRARTALTSAFEQIPWLQNLDAGDQLYLVGGTWRALARAHMAHKAYPLAVLHRYAVSTKSLRSYAEKIITCPTHRLDAMEPVSGPRRRKLPWAGLAVSCLIQTLSTERAVFSGAGLREGFSAKLLGRDDELTLPQVQRYDRAIRALIPDGGRFGTTAAHLYSWIEPLFDDEVDSLKDRRAQACQLFDFGWETHPSYRDVDIPSTVLHATALTQNHRDRTYLGLVLLLRHGGNHKDVKAHPWLKLLKLLPKKQRRHALVTGRALYLAHRVSRGIVPLIQATSLKVEDLRLVLQVHAQELMNIQTHYFPALTHLAEALALEPEVREVPL